LKLRDRPAPVRVEERTRGRTVIDSAFDHLSARRLTIRRFRASDAEALATYRADPAVARYQAWESSSLEEARAFIGSLATRHPGQPGWFQFAFVLEPSGRLIGDCGLRRTRAEPGQAELGFTVARAHQGQGYAAEAIARVLTYAFETLLLHRVFSVTDERNRAAQRLLERLGFRREARFVEASWFKGAWATELSYAVLRTEWQRPGRD
jgi:RimJ/RimL family protein N-acetyltransferase